MCSQPNLRMMELLPIAATVNLQQPLALTGAQDNTAVHGSVSRVVVLATTTLGRAAFGFKGSYLGARFISVPLLFNFIVAYLTASRAAVKQVFTGPNHLEGYDAVINDAAFTMIVLSLAMLAFGAGRFSLDYLVSRAMTRHNHNRSA